MTQASEAARASEPAHGDTVHSNPWFGVRHTEVDSQDWFEVIRSDSAMTIAVADDGSVVVVRGTRHTTGTESYLELPSGALDVGEAPDQAARRELLEETGFSVGELTALGWFFECPGITASKCHVFLGTVTGRAAAELEPGEEWNTELISADELRLAMSSGAIRDAGTLAAFALYWRGTGRNA